MADAAMSRHKGAAVFKPPQEKVVASRRENDRTFHGSTWCLIAAGSKLRYISKTLTFKTTLLAEHKVAMTFSLTTNL